MSKCTVPVEGLMCAVCAANVENKVKSLKNVRSASVNFSANSLTVDYDDRKISIEQIRDEVRSIGYDLLVDASQEEVEKKEISHFHKLRRQLIVTWILAIVIMVLMMIPAVPRVVLLVLATVMIAYSGRGFYVRAFKLLRHGSANMDTLVTLSTLIAYLFSLFNTVYPEFWSRYNLETHVYYDAVGMVIAFVLTGKFIEERAKGNTTSAIKGLMGLQPKSAFIITEEGEKEIPVSDIAVGDMVSVHPGERIPVDGMVSSGNSYVDESMISGEPVPVFKQSGVKVLSGTINQRGSLVVRATQVGSETVLSQIIRMVQEAQGSKAPVQRLADRISAVFVPVVVSISFISFLLWMILGGSGSFPFAILSAASVLVIACPCALGLATPTALTVGIGKAAQNHILIKDAVAIEQMCRVTDIVLDKTGTLTEGKPAVVGMYRVGPVSDNDFAVLSAMEKKSEHPYALAVCSYYKDMDISSVDLSLFESITGRGVRCNAGDAVYWAGNRAYADSFGIKTDAVSDSFVNDEKNQGCSFIYFGRDNVLLAVYAINDPLKSTSAEAVSSLQGAGITVHLLTGDTAATASVVADRLHISHVRAGVLPQDKEDYIKSLQAEGKVVAMVGDGINDSQALARADVSVAMGHGTDIAMDVAMVTLMTSDLGLLPKAIRLSHLTVRHIRENLFWAFIYNLICIPVAAGVLYPVCGLLLNPMYAGAAMAFSSVSVVLNSLRLKRRKI